MIKIPTFQAPGSPKKQKSQKSPASGSRRSLSVFSRKGQDFPVTQSTQSLALAGLALGSPSSPIASSNRMRCTSLNHGPPKKWTLRRSSGSHHAVGSESAPLTALEFLMETSPNDEILKNIATKSENHDQVVEEPVDLSSLTGPILDTGKGRTDRPTIQLRIPSTQSPTPSYVCSLENHTDEASSTSKNEVVPSSPGLLTVSNHQRNVSSSSDGSITSDEDKDSDRASKRSSITSMGSDAEAGRRSFEDAKPGNDFSDFSGDHNEESEHTPEEPEEPEVVDTTPRLSVLVDMLRTPSTRRAPHTSKSFSGDVQKLRTLPEDEEGRYSELTTDDTETDLEVLIALQIKKWEQGPGSPLFAHLRKPVPPPKSERRLSKVIPVVEEPTSPAPPARRPPPPPVPTKKSTLKRSNSIRSILTIIDEEEQRQISPDDAEWVLYLILCKSSDLEDLFNLALTNKAFYGVVKQNELDLMQKVLKNMSPAAWEFKQTSPFNDNDEPNSAAPAPEYTAASFFSTYLRDYYIIASLKQIIHERCQSVIRANTSSALLESNPLRKSAVDDALWRIWTFSKIFGCGKEREEDMTTQLDWLRGGLIAHQTTASGDFASSDPWFASSALLSASEHFARGNENGLTAEHLYDMTEMWNCLRIISHGVLGETGLARTFGIFDSINIPDGDEQSEEAIVEEWHNYLLTLGLSAINKVSSAETPLSAFQVANVNHWNQWPYISFSQGTTTTRSNFLREPVNRLYEERIIESFSPSDAINRELQRTRRRRRTSLLATELKEQKALLSLPSSPTPSNRSKFPGSPTRSNASRFSSSSPTRSRFPTNSPTPSFGSRFPTASISEEIPMSRANTVLDRLNSSSGSIQTTPLPSPLRAPPAIPISPLQSPNSEEDERHIHPALRSRPTSSVFSSPGSPPSYEPAAMQHPFQMALMSNDPSTTSSDRAIFRIVEMGFTSEQAKGALKITDMGDGLRVDRAVEYLLRQAE
jgi:hypothetical protein